MRDTWTILQIDWRDLVDILLVSTLFYQVYRMMKGTRAIPMFVGMLLLFFVYVVVQLLDLTLVSLIFREFTTVWAIAIVILFQPELRRFLIQMGNSPIFSRIFQIRSSGLYETVAEAAQDLSKRQYGGLFVLIRDVGLRAIQETGVKLQAELTKETLVTIVFPRTPLHDGAVMISGSIIQAAKCLLPLSTNPNLDVTMGTRHRAAIGVTEESDAVVVVVSEETGAISLAVDGKLNPVHDPAKLAQTLQNLMVRRK